MSGVAEPIEFSPDEGNYGRVGEIDDEAAGRAQYDQIVDPLDPTSVSAREAADSAVATRLVGEGHYQTLVLNAATEVGTSLFQRGGDAVPDLVPAADQPAAQGAIDQMEVEVIANPKLRNRVLHAVFYGTLGLVFTGGGIAIAYAIWGTTKKAEQQKAIREKPTAPPPPMPPNTSPDFDQHMTDLVDRWNALDDDKFFDAFKNFVTTAPEKSVSTVFYIATFARGLAAANQSSLLIGAPVQLDRKVQQLVTLWNSQQSIAPVLSAASTLTIINAGKTESLNRYDKLNVLTAALLKIIQANLSSGSTTTATTV